MTDDPAFKVLMANASAMKRGALSLWTIYEKPLDHAHGFIARRFESDAPTEDTLTGELEEIRTTLERAGLIKLTRDPAEEPQIVETWI